jgi:AcrR family transcriptional regulator
MPKAPMNEAEINAKKERIIDTAAEVVMEDGFRNLSMRKIGTKIGMTAANIYNYYSNKDELNIAIRTRAGNILFTALDAAYREGGGIAEKMARMIEAYIRFGVERPNYYSIMFDMQTPKYADYVGTALETQAWQEKESSERSLALLRQCVEDLKHEGYTLPENTGPFLIMIWGQLHGLVSLFNNRIIAEISGSPERTLKEAGKLGYGLLFNHIGHPGGNP